MDECKPGAHVKQRGCPRGSCECQHAAGALAVATACGLDMIRINVHCGAMVTDQGIVEGDAAGTLKQQSVAGF